MGYLPEAHAAALAGRVVRGAALAFFDFVGEPMRYWTGAGKLRTGDGLVWDGTGGLGRISGLPQTIGTTAQKATFTLSGVDSRVAALARQQSAKVVGRDVEVLFQLFAEDWSLLDLPVVFWAGELDVMNYGADGQGGFTVSVTAEGVWTGRSRPPFGFYTNADQQARFPGQNDRGCEFVASLPGKDIPWPSAK